MRSTANAITAHDAQRCSVPVSGPDTLVALAVVRQRGKQTRGRLGDGRLSKRSLLATRGCIRNVVGRQGRPYTSTLVPVRVCRFDPGLTFLAGVAPGPHHSLSNLIPDATRTAPLPWAGPLNGSHIQANGGVPLRRLLAYQYEQPALPYSLKVKAAQKALEAWYEHEG